ncbi:MAG TPA: MarR family transcriptional regulator [Roseiflexaceae bacterium]|nr:MarR family transcriptional regulator [Roseiflexaceae bacterium]
MTRDREQHQFCTSFYRLNWEMHKHAMDSLERIQLTAPQRTVLCILDDLGGSATMCDLIERSFQSGPTLTRIVDRMVASGLVARERDEQDRRQVFISLTQAGRAKHAEATALGVSEGVLLTEQLSDEELVLLNRLMDKLLAGMEAVRATAPLIDPHCAA